MDTAIAIEPFDATHPGTLEPVRVVGIAYIQGELKPGLIALRCTSEGISVDLLEYVKGANHCQYWRDGTTPRWLDDMPWRWHRRLRWRARFRSWIRRRH
jgi:hypothetical protein